MRAHAWAAVGIGSWLVASTGHAAAPSRAWGARPTLEVVDGAAPFRDPAWAIPRRARPAWQASIARWGPRTRARWDPQTGIPSRVWGMDAPVPGAVNDPAIAKAHARTMLAAHVMLLAPGARPADFELVSNVVHQGLRSVGFRQTLHSLPIEGAAVSFRYKADRLLLVGSEAVLPNTPAAGPAIDGDAARARAEAWVADDLGNGATAHDVEGPLWLPLAGRPPALVLAVDVTTRAPAGRYRVYVDAAKGAPVARRSMLHFASGQVAYDVPIRWPGGARDDYPAADVTLTVDGTPTTADAAGNVSWPGNANASVTTSLTSAVATVASDAPIATSITVPLAPGGLALWSDPANDEVDAALATLIHIGVGKAHIDGLDPDAPFATSNTAATVNVDDVCNAFYDSIAKSLTFFGSSPQCGNTGRLADVVYHELGHAVHDARIIEGVGRYEGGLGEGYADYLTSSITDDPAMGIGFFKTAQPLRHIDPDFIEYSWPDDVLEAHHAGQIVSGALWDLRKLLIAEEGAAEGAAITDRLALFAVARATDMPTMYLEVLAEDDDDGNLDNGTPHGCAINEAFGVHGLKRRAFTVDAPTVTPANPDGHDVAITLEAPLFLGCPGDAIANVRVIAQDRDAPGATQYLTTFDGTSHRATLPSIAAGRVLQYRFEVEYADGSRVFAPDNHVAPFYEMYVGEVVPLYCTDFESDPFAEGWTASASGAGAHDWTWGPAVAAPAGDPAAAHSGDAHLGMGLDDGAYDNELERVVTSPAIDTQGFTNLRVQYWRWLTVEDGFYDQATIESGGSLLWANHDSQADIDSARHHVDREWRFQDLPLPGGESQVRFRLTTDEGLELGGWNVDDFCIVGIPDPVCGDGTLDSGEACDDGDANSATAPDACRPDCQPASCGDGVVDSGEACDGSPDCSAMCQLIPAPPPPPAPESGYYLVEQPCVCQAPGGTTPSGRALWSWLALAALAWRRRGRAHL